MPLVAVFIRNGQNRSMYLPKVVPGGSCVPSIKTVHDNNNARNNKNNANTVTMTLLIVIIISQDSSVSIRAQLVC